MQRQGRLSYLLFDEIDMITGDYINKTRAAAAQIAAARNPTGIILLTGCQSALLSTDYGLLTQEIEGELGIPVRVHDGCRLCGFDEEAPSAGTGTLNQLLYDFIRPGGKSGAPSVNILGTAELDTHSELFSVLEAAGVKRINCLAACKSREDYQEMGRAHLNIVVSAQDMPIGPYLQERLGIPWVGLGGIYDADELARAYEKLGAALGAAIDVAPFKNKLDEKLQAVKSAVGGRAIAVDGDAEMARWLLNAGFSVTGLSLPSRQGLTQAQRGWFEENATNLKIERSGRGGGNGGGRGGGYGGEKGRDGGGKGRGGGYGDVEGAYGGRGGAASSRRTDAGFGYKGAAAGGRRAGSYGGSDMGRGRGQRERGARDAARIKAGYAGSMEILSSLERIAGGGMQ